MSLFTVDDMDRITEARVFRSEKLEGNADPAVEQMAKNYQEPRRRRKLSNYDRKMIENIHRWMDDVAYAKRS